MICYVAKQNKSKISKTALRFPAITCNSGQHFAGNSELFPVWRHSFRNVARSWHLAETVSLLDVMWPWTSQWMGALWREKRQLYNKKHYYSFKIFSRFWLVKTTRIIHHNQLLFTKFGKNLRHIESMTSKVEPCENYGTNDVKMTSKVQSSAGYWTVDREKQGKRLCYIWWTEKTKSVMAKLL